MQGGKEAGRQGGREARRGRITSGEGPAGDDLVDFAHEVDGFGKGDDD